jgi:hypothetical protein
MRVTELNWKEAKLGYLYDIAYHDKGCELKYKLAAIEELQRRAKLITVNHRRKTIKWG